jgi:hypothetical protein
MAAPPDVVLECGCFIHCDEATLTMRISPCRQDCKVLRFALEEAEARGVPVGFEES